MAKLMTLSPDDADRGFHALSDPTRRAVIASLITGEAPASDLAQPFEMALPTFLKHLKVLEAGGLISTRKEGRQRICRLQPERLAQLSGWITEYERGWQNRLSRLEALIEKKD
jgi:DNA-binding transcriptional ArsR family regulator